MIGQVLDGRYRILSKLGEGGMGEVYLVEHVNLGRREALKILHAALADTPEFVSRFRREARATNRVQHPNIVSVYDFGRLPDGRFYLAMEHADGESLFDVLQRLGPLPLPRTLGILSQLADAVDHAHSRGVVHRDLKPENLVLVEHRGRSDVVKVLDFGIAKIVAPDYSETQNVTRKGEVFGTASYMAPEQFAGTGADARSDIYAIGCIAFELVVGEPPFLGRAMELMHAHSTRAPDLPSRRRPQAAIPPLLDELILRCLEKDPTRRFQTGRELQVALERVPGYRAPKSGGGRRREVTPQEFEADTQERRFSEPTLLATAATDLDRAQPTELLTTDEARRCVQELERQLAEALVDAGHDDVQLRIGLTNVQEQEDELLRNETEMAALEARAAEVEQSARAREGTLRFALGELYYERSQTIGRGKTPHPEIEGKIEELQQRLGQLAGEVERELAASLDRSISLAAARADIEERLADTYASLGQLLDGMLARVSSSDTLVWLAQRLAAAREALAAAQRLGRP